MGRPEPHTRSIIGPQPPARFLLLRNLQPFTTPDSLDSILTNSPARMLQQRSDAAILLASCHSLMSNGEDTETIQETLRHANFKTIQETLRHANFKVTMDMYTQGNTEIRRTAHSQIVSQMMGMEGKENEE